MSFIEKNPTVTVIVCAYQSGKEILPTLQSILAQSYTDFEFLIIDDASGDTTPDVIRSIDDPRISLIENEKNLGVVGSRNKGIRMARGEFIAHCDHDDIWAPDKLTKQVAFLSDNPDYGLVSTNLTKTIGGKTIRQSDTVHKSHNFLRWSILLDSTFAHSAVLYRSECVSKHHLQYYPEYTFADDWDFFLQIAKVTKIACIPEPLVIYRLHEANWSNRASDEMHSNGKAVFYKEINYWLESSVLKEDTDAYFDVMVRGVPGPAFEQLIKAGSIGFKLYEAFMEKCLPDSNDTLFIRKLMSEHWWRAVRNFANRNGPGNLRIFFSQKTPNWNPPGKHKILLEYLKCSVKTILLR
ncbi:MAG: hypothetical protein DRR42_23695 [Gammaproteobacteria bacterium]|nr:MAG: hypothetical protein DRR42_23695 [Gammaproteobacteria bacterium]